MVISQQAASDRKRQCKDEEQATKANVTLAEWAALLQPEAPALYVGANGSGNPFHYHQQTWNALIAGRKRWLVTRFAQLRRRLGSHLKLGY